MFKRVFKILLKRHLILFVLIITSIIPAIIIFTTNTSISLKYIGVLLLMLAAVIIFNIVFEYNYIKDELIKQDEKELKELLYMHLINFITHINITHNSYRQDVYVSKEIYDIVPIGLLFDYKYNFVVEDRRKLFSCSLKSINDYVEDFEEFFEYS